MYRLHAGGKSRNDIASALDRATSTISRELKRNSRPTKVWRGGYEPVRAQQLAERRRRQDGRFKLARQPALRDCVGKSLAMGHSPEQIAGRLAREHGRVMISHESIYRFIYHRTAQKDYWHRLLPRHKLRRGRRRRPGGSPASFIKQRRSIDERPSEVEGRGTPGHWEADFMLFARYGQGLLVLHGRQARFSSQRGAQAYRRVLRQHRAASTRSESCPHPSDHRPSTWQASTGDPQNHQLPRSAVSFGTAATDVPFDDHALTRIVNGHPNSDIDQLLSWAFAVKTSKLWPENDAYA
ncbi:IS30 family transposase [Bradyrhizobium septentrionale]|uniref:IS30 family transposase n=1 Tax=Bradyrhizobium septentrionale TaxID=1404411 RepID=A0ABZ2PB93_9BRAD